MAGRVFAIAVLLLLLVTAFSVPASMAQDQSVTASADEKAETAKVAGLDFSKIPPEYLAEMDGVYQKCKESDVSSTYYDCRCQAMRFLEERIKAGSETHSNILMLKINKECANTAGIAGYSLGVCVKMMEFREYSNYQKLCECFANTVAEKYAERPMLESQSIVSIQSEAYVECGMTKELAKRALSRRKEK